MTSFRFLRDSGQVDAGDPEICEDEILLRQIVTGNIVDVKKCMECLMKDHLQ